MLEGKNIQPDKILVRKIIKGETITSSGIVIPGVAQESSCEGEVVLVGSVIANWDNPIKVGQKVLYPPRAPQFVKTDEGEFYLLDKQNVLLFW